MVKGGIYLSNLESAREANWFMHILQMISEIPSGVNFNQRLDSILSLLKTEYAWVKLYYHVLVWMSSSDNL